MNLIISPDGTDLDLALSLRELRNQGALSLAHIADTPMVKVTTRTGRSICLSPESMFAIHKQNAAPIIDGHALGSTLPPMFFSAERQPISYEYDPRLWYICGLVLSSGKVTTDSRAGRIYLPGSRRIEIERLHAFMVEFRAKNPRTQGGRVPVDTRREVNDVVTQSSSIIDQIVALCGIDANATLLTMMENEIHDEIERRLFANLMDHLPLYPRAGFLAGILAGSKVTPEGRVFTHRSALIVETVARWLWETYAVPTELSIHPLEPRVQWQKSGTTHPHSFLLRREFYQRVQAAGLAHWDEDMLFEGGSAGVEPFADPIASILPMEPMKAVRLSGEGFVNINGFHLDLEFEVPEIATEIATMPELFADVLDPAAVLANANVHHTHLHGEI